MAFTRRKNPINEQQQQSTPNEVAEQNTETATMTTEACEYEKTREQRIKENRERLQKLGIVDLSHQLNSSISSASNTPNRRTPRSHSDRKTPLKSPSLGPSAPSRRSSRLQNAPPVSYVEPKDDKSRKNRDIVLEEGAKPEFYTEEHDKLLGSTEMPWTFFVDGYSADGTRIYDPVRGKTCHQCRQKTLGQRTRCCQCNLVQGQFCGDCLYMRYGEHVVEANQNPNWICPPCRGICNCSLCRQAKGWYATGALYKRISNLGYKSVAHYLIQTKRAPPEVDTVSDTQQSAKRTLPFEGMEFVPGDDYSGDNVGDAKNATPDIEPNPTLEDARRSGRMSMKDNASAGEVAEYDSVHDKKSPEEVAMNAVVMEDALVPDIKSPKARGRPRKNSKTENVDLAENAGKESVETAGGPEDTPVLAIKSPKARGRARKRSKTDDVDVEDAGEESVVNADVVVDVPVPDIKISKARGRPRKKSKAENVDVAEDTGEELVVNAGVAEDAPVPDEKSPDAIERPTKGCKTENAEMAEDAPVSESIGVC